MEPAPASRLLAVAAAACAVAVLGACRTTEERWYKGDAGKTNWEKKLDSSVQQNMDTMNALSRGDDAIDYVGSEFDQKNISSKTSRYDNKRAKQKSFRTKKFAGADEYQHGDYEFLKRQKFDTGTSADQNQRFADGATKAPDARRKFFWQRKEARTKISTDNSKIAPTGDYGDTAADINRLSRRQPTIVEDPAQEAGVTMSIGDVRTLLNSNGQ